MSGPSAVAEVDVIATTRRRWSAAERRAILAEPGEYKVEPDTPIPPNVNAARKRALANAARARARRAEEDKRARIEADKRAQEQAKRELAVIEEEDARLRDRRQVLRRKLHSGNL